MELKTLIIISVFVLASHGAIDNQNFSGSSNNVIDSDSANGIKYKPERINNIKTESLTPKYEDPTLYHGKRKDIQQPDNKRVLYDSPTSILNFVNCTNCKGNCSTSGVCNGGCTTGFYGPTCGNQCDSNCFPLFGCNSNGSCVACNADYYGDLCHLKCNPNCWTCSKDDGVCVACTDGWYGRECNMSCSAECIGRCSQGNGACVSCSGNVWGTHCNQTCPVHCRNGCDIHTGFCSNGCINGFSGNRCEYKCQTSNCASCIVTLGWEQCSSCDAGWFGDNCNHKCHAHCHNTRCSMFNGDCDCAVGWYGDTCNSSCMHNCDQCVDSTTCSRCTNGFYGAKCENRCSSGCTSCSKSGDQCLTCSSSDTYGSICQCRVDQCHQTNNTTGDCISCVDNTWYPSDKGCCPCSTHCKGTSNPKTGSCNSTCVENYYGDRCDNVCSTHCQVPGCNMVNGYCVPTHDGYCYPGFYTPRCNFDCNLNYPHCSSCYAVALGNDKYETYCQKCETGFHFVGYTCVPCDHCVGNRCNTTTGECLAGCVSGWYSSGPGNLCDSRCSPNCINQSCSTTNGACIYGCIHGYFDEKCSRHCPINCKNNHCDSYLRMCMDGCIDGFYGSKCTRACPLGCLDNKCYNNGTCIACPDTRFGDDCSLSCEKCIEGTCDRESGCPNSCLPGYWGIHCDRYCEDFGRRSDTCFACEKTEGKCIQCEAGFVWPYPAFDSCGVNCTLYNVTDDCSNPWDNHTSDIPGACPIGCHGYNCSVQCPERCRAPDEINMGNHSEGYCDKYTGSCSNGCVDGYYGAKCSHECQGCYNIVNNRTICDGLSGECVGCQTGLWGKRCDITCPARQHCLSGSGCGQYDGDCYAGCNRGYMGQNCYQECFPHCIHNVCGQFNASCTFGCADGYDGITCSDKIPPEHKSFRLKNMQIVGICVGSVAFLVLLGVVLKLTIYKRKNSSAISERGLEKNKKDGYTRYGVD